MPVQINEVIIRAVVTPHAGEEEGSEVQCPPDSGSSEGEIMERILEIIKEKSQR